MMPISEIKEGGFYLVTVDSGIAHRLVFQVINRLAVGDNRIRLRVRWLNDPTVDTEVIYIEGVNNIVTADEVDIRLAVNHSVKVASDTLKRALSYGKIANGEENK